MLAWVLTSVGLWVVVLPPSWLLVNGVRMAAAGSGDPPTSFWEVALLSYVYAGLLPLVVVVGVLWYLGRVESPPFRPAAIITSLLFGGWFGLYLILLPDPTIETVLLAWAAFGALVPRPPVRPGLGPPSLGPEPPVFRP